MNHYVYEITNNINNKKYIGKRSCKCLIENDKYMGSGVAITKAIKKYGVKNFNKKIVKTFSTEQEAFDYEKYWIKECDAVKSRMFYNIKDGGEGNSSEDCKRIMMNLSKEKREIRRKKLSALNSGVKNSMYGKTGKNNPTSKSIVMLSIINGELLQSFNCIGDANNYIGKNRTNSAISRTCRNKYGNSYGYFWLFKDDYIELQKNDELKNWMKYNKELVEKNKRKGIKLTHLHNKKEIYMLNPNTYEIIKKYNSIHEASVIMNIKSTNISRNCNYKCNTAGGYSWMFVEEYNKLSKEKLYKLCEGKYKPNPIENSFRRKVVCTTTGQVFESIENARRYFDLCKGVNIISVCKGRRNFTGKHPITKEPLKWMYYEDYINTYIN